tara:strand:- start:135 stop:350 length:216 start_codon:yes stop_codon:yes gene_type:complete
MEAYTNEHGTNHVKLTKDSDHVWIDTGNGERIFVYNGYKGVGMTLWVNEGVKYTKTTRNGTIINIKPKSDY